MHDLGADVPAESFVEVASDADRLIAVGIGATSVDNERNIREATTALEPFDVPVVLGGSAVRDGRHASELGADRYAANGAELVDLFVTYASQRRSR